MVEIGLNPPGLRDISIQKGSGWGKGGRDIILAQARMPEWKIRKTENKQVLSDCVMGEEENYARSLKLRST